MNSTRKIGKFGSLAIVTAGGTAIFAGVCLYRNNDKFYRNVVMPVVHRLDPELTHRIAVVLNKYNLLPASRFADPPSLAVRAFGRQFSNPVGVAAGLDKHGEAVRGLHRLGFGFVEVGSVTPKPQPGNPKPRVFRLLEDRAVINRYGFNSDGHDAVHQRLALLKDGQFSGVVGVNLGKNKDQEYESVDDYVEGIKRFGSVADYLVINISSPNTPGLRSMQEKDVLQRLLRAARDARDELTGNRPPLLLKLSPDLTSQQRREIADVLRRKDCQVDGLVISNTTVNKPADLKSSEHAGESGGLSGVPLKTLSTEMIREMYELTEGMPIIGVGGVFSGQDAYDKIRAGASLVQVYTAFIYDGPPCSDRIKKELLALLRNDGFDSVAEAVGADTKLKRK